jgi:hypothetical protein
MEKGLNPGGFLVCKFAFKVCQSFRLRFVLASILCFGLQRVEGQPALPVRDLEAETANNDQDNESDAEADEEAELADDDVDADGEDET